MQIENNDINIGVRLSLSEIRLIEYALKKVEDDTNPDLLFSDISNLLIEFKNILTKNWVGVIQDEDDELILPTGTKIEIL
ncbi:MAG: hypothetical protein AABY22_15835 [Nanoarchaeota archaeon]